MFRNLLLSGFVTLYGVVIANAADTPKADAAPKNEQFERMKKLVGTWVKTDKDGKPTAEVVSVVKLTGGGAVLHETLFPDTPMEMVSVYHLDKGDLVMTHYCALGNQPHLKADPKSPTNTVEFKFVSGKNMDAAKDLHMHDATLKFADDDHYEICGTPWQDGKPAENHCGEMKLVRKK
jgi:hypothetical protein